RAWVVAGVAAIAMALVTARTLSQKEVYQGQFRVLVEPVNAGNDVSQLTSALGEQRLSRSSLDYETQVQVLRSPELMEPVAEQLSKTYPELSYLSLLSGLSINRLGDTKILEVNYTGSNPVKIQVVLDQLSKTYLKYSLEERQTNLRQGINFVEGQLPELQSQVDKLQNQLEAFRRQYNFIDPEAQSSLLSKQVSRLDEQRLQLEGNRALAEQTFSNLQAQDGALAALDGAPVYQQLIGELRSVEAKIAEELTRFEPDSLSIRVLEERRNNLIPLLEQEAQRSLSTKQAIAANNLRAIATQSETLASAEGKAEQGLDQLPALIRQYTDLQRELEVATAALNRFRLTRESLEIEAAQTEIPWQLIEVPVQPTRPISPNIPRGLATGAIASLLLGLGAAFLIEKLDNVYHTVDELKAGIKLPMLGTLPFNRDLKDSQLAPKRSISHGYHTYGGNDESSFLEAMRVLHTNIRMLSSDRPIRSIIISSALPGDGKSTVATNLAQVATAMGQRVLIVDTDLRKPQIHDRLDLPNNLGLSNLIADDLPLKSVMQQFDGSGQLFVLTAGKIPPDPTKLLSSHKMQQLMGTFERCFDLVIYDAPPATGLADVSLIGQRTDGLVLVTYLGKTDKTVLKQTVETLKLAQITTLGLVANGVKISGLSGYRYYTYGDAAGDSDTLNSARSTTGITESQTVSAYPFSPASSEDNSSSF
ncbi:MAG: polysaccharide biosynthesis tyrosine autokinase, partial [Phormidesmis sp.]